MSSLTPSSIFALGVAMADAAARDAELNRELLERIGEATPDLIYAKDLESRMIFANPAVLNAIGKSWDEARGRSDIEWHDRPEEARRFMEADARVAARGLTESFEETHTGPAGTQVFLSTKSPLRDRSGRVIGIFGISKNITERKKDEAQKRLMMEEMNHRVKNTLAIVQSMARRTLQDAVADKALWAAFEARLLAMSQAHSILARDSWVGADIGDIVADTLGSYGREVRERAAIEGAATRVDAQTALALAMVLHELGANALKYGALSTPEGRVSVKWTVESTATGQILDFSWSESGGPEVTPPQRRGFGSRLIETAFARDQANRAAIEYRREGVQWRLRVGLFANAAARAPEPRNEGAVGDGQLSLF